MSRWHNGSVSALKSKDMWFDPGSVQDFSHKCDVLGLSGWLGAIVTEQLRIHPKGLCNLISRF